jgi:hypothetical protein
MKIVTFFVIFCVSRLPVIRCIVCPVVETIRDKKIRIIVYNSICFGWTSNLLILSGRELNLLPFSIFYLIPTLLQLEISVSQKRQMYMSVEPFNGTEDGAALLHSQKDQSPRYSYKTFIYV